ncbi:MAG: hypothetical protein JXR42_01175 [Gammaproteobacteria bacterium]|nr:hypothetical protein [Gammaproteobacteria bacterium]
MKKIFLLLTATIFSASCFAMIPNEYNSTTSYQGKWWFNLGAGTMIAKKNKGTGVTGIAGEISGNYATTNNQLLTIAVQDNFAGFYNVTSYNVMYGLMKKNDEGYISGSAGLGYTHAGEDLFGFTMSTNGLNIPFEAQAFLTPYQHVGFGLIGFVNVLAKNGLHPYGGVMLAIQFGDLK